MTTQFQIHRVTALPEPVTPNSVYFVAVNDSAEHTEIYVVGNTADKVRRVFNKKDIEDLINDLVATKLQTVGQVKVVDTHADLASIGHEIVAYVKDATDGDDTVKSGGAMYVKTDDTWTKVAEFESLDLVQDWEKIENKPTKTAQEIDDAVANSHTHANRTQLDKIGEDGQGNFTYNGKSVTTAWTTTDW